MTPNLTDQWVTATDAGWLLRFPQPCQRLSMNDRLHWARRQELTKAWKDAAFWWARSNGLPSRSVGERVPMYVRVTFPVTDRRRRDSDNPAPTVKAIVDGLVLAGVWPDDTPIWVETLGSRFTRDSKVVTVELIRREDVQL